MSHSGLYLNQLPELLDSEIANANRLSASRLGPTSLTINSPEFNAAVNDDEGTIKWAVTQAGELYVIPKFIAGEEIPHTILTSGEPVLAAGEAIIAGADGEFIGLEINRHSGHYQPGAESLDIGVRAFAEWGITFAIIDREMPQ